MTEQTAPNTSAEIVLLCFDGEYTFSLKLKQIDELQRLCDAGLGTIVKRVVSGDFRVRDIYDTIRLGLVGAGLDPVTALRLVNTYVDGKALMLPRQTENGPSSPYLVARAILNAAYFGMPELSEVAGEEAVKKKTESPTDSTSEPSTDKA